jgi:hypothetical protein
MNYYKVKYYDGVEEFYYDLEGAALYVGKRGHINYITDGVLSTIWVNNSYQWTYDEFGWKNWYLVPDGMKTEAIVYDDLGLRVPAWKVRYTYFNLPQEWRIPAYSRRKGYDPDKHFRNGPVHGISHRKWGNWYRGPKTYQEIRENNFADKYDEDIEYYKIKIRKIRNKLPTWWDEKVRSDHKDRSWKNNRKNQWKE